MIRLHSAPFWGRTRLCALLALGLAGSALPGSAQQIPFQMYGLEQGLSNLQFQGMAQDSENMLWVGTRNGLYLFTGERFRRYDELDGLPSAYVERLTLYKGRLFVATDAGLAVRSGARFVSPLLPGDVDARIRFASMANSGERLFLGADDGVYELTGPDADGSWRLIHRVSTQGVKTIYASNDGRLWIGGAGRLKQWNVFTGELSEAGPALAEGRFWRSLLETADGSFWAYSDDALWRRRPGARRFEPAGYRVPKAFRHSNLCRTPDGGLALPTTTGLLLWQAGRWSLLDASHGLPHAPASDVLWDHEGNLWVSLYGAGLAREKGGGRWRTWTSAEGLPDSSVTAVTQDPRGALWVATDAGIARLNASGAVERTLSFRDGLPNDAARTMAADFEGYLWVGYGESGVARIRLVDLSVTRFGRAQGLSNGRLVVLRRDPQGRIWAATRGGLFRASPDGNKFESCPLPFPGQDQTVYDVAFAPSGEIWVGTHDGLFRGGPGAWRRLDERDGLLEASVFALAAAKDGSIWAGYGGLSGVSRLQEIAGRLRVQHFKAGDALISNNLNSLDVDRFGRAWVGTDRGLDVYETGRWRHFGFENGLAWGEVAAHAFYDDPMGGVWIGTAHGLSRFEAPKILPPPPSLGIWLSEAGFGDPPDPALGHDFDWNHRSLTVRFAPSSFEYGRDAQVRLRLLGLSSEWAETAEHAHTFSHLAPGDYALEIQARASGGSWDGPVKRFAFSILPPWWRTWWATLAFTAALFALVRLALVLRVRRQFARQRELEQLVNERARMIARQQRDLEAERAAGKQARIEARESDRRFWSVLEGVQLPALILDRDGVVTYASQSLVELLARPDGEVLGRNWFAGLKSEACSRETAHFRAAIDAGAEYGPSEYEVLDGQGNWRTLYWNNMLLREVGGATGMICLGADVTERRRLEARVREAQRIESLGRLAGGVAHDFNNLLTVINGYSRLSLAELEGDAALRDRLEEIVKAGERAAGLTRQLLAFSRKQVLQPRVLNLNRVVEDTRSILRRLLGEDVELRFAPSAASLTVRADPHQLEQVIMNLAANARDAMPRGGWLLLETGLVERDESYAASHPEAPCGRYAVLSVSDNGVGMNEATRQQIFEPFFTTKGVGEGTGLGLSMVQGIVAQSGGYIDVYSEPGRGTTFKIHLPALAEEAADPAEPAAVSAQRGNETILVVEDQTEVREYAVVALETYGYRVIQAANAGQALKISERESAPIHLVLTDVVMPYTSGQELVTRLAKMRPGLKVLFMSGYTDDVLGRHGVLETGIDLIEKPFSPAELANKVRQVLGPPALAVRVLVVDEDAGVRSFLRAVLQPGGYEVTEAADAKQALRQALTGDLDLVIMDLLPEQEGVEAIEELRRQLPGVGIIAISGAFAGQCPEIAQAQGADAVLDKPVDPGRLLETAAEVLELRR